MKEDRQQMLLEAAKLYGAVADWFEDAGRRCGPATVEEMDLFDKVEARLRRMCRLLCPPEERTELLQSAGINEMCRTERRRAESWT